MHEEDGRGPKASESETMVSVASVGAAEVTVIRQTQWGEIREMWSRGMSKKGIARGLQIDVKTVKKWLKRSTASREVLEREYRIDRARFESDRERAIEKIRSGRS